MPARNRRRSNTSGRMVEVGVRVTLTAAEVRKLRDLPAADLRSVAGLVAWFVSQDLERPASPHRKVRGASPLDRRTRHSIDLRLSPSERSAMRKRADAEMRSVSGYVSRVIVEALARK